MIEETPGPVTALQKGLACKFVGASLEYIAGIDRFEKTKKYRNPEKLMGDEDALVGSITQAKDMGLRQFALAHIINFSGPVGRKDAERALDIFAKVTWPHLEEHERPPMVAYAHQERRRDAKGRVIPDTNKTWRTSIHILAGNIDQKTKKVINPYLTLPQKKADGTWETKTELGQRMFARLNTAFELWHIEQGWITPSQKTGRRLTPAKETDLEKSIKEQGFSKAKNSKELKSEIESECRMQLFKDYEKLKQFISEKWGLEVYESRGRLSARFKDDNQQEKILGRLKLKLDAEIFKKEHYGPDTNTRGGRDSLPGNPQEPTNSTADGSAPKQTHRNGHDYRTGPDQHQTGDIAGPGDQSRSFEAGERGNPAGLRGPTKEAGGDTEDPEVKRTKDLRETLARLLEEAKARLAGTRVRKKKRKNRNSLSDRGLDNDDTIPVLAQESGADNIQTGRGNVNSSKSTGLEYRPGEVDPVAPENLQDSRPFGAGDSHAPSTPESPDQSRENIPGGISGPEQPIYIHQNDSGLRRDRGTENNEITGETNSNGKEINREIHDNSAKTAIQYGVTIEDVLFDHAKQPKTKPEPSGLGEYLATHAKRAARRLARGISGAIDRIKGCTRNFVEISKRTQNANEKLSSNCEQAKRAILRTEQQLQNAQGFSQRDISQSGKTGKTNSGRIGPNESSSNHTPTPTPEDRKRPSSDIMVTSIPSALQTALMKLKLRKKTKEVQKSGPER